MWTVTWGRDKRRRNMRRGSVYDEPAIGGIDQAGPCFTPRCKCVASAYHARFFIAPSLIVLRVGATCPSPKLCPRENDLDFELRFCACQSTQEPRDSRKIDMYAVKIQSKALHLYKFQWTPINGLICFGSRGSRVQIPAAPVSKAMSDCN